jgi:hypothetical protein
VSPTGALLIADRVRPQHPIARRLVADPGDATPLFFQHVWLKHGGFAVADCFWAAPGYAVYGGFKTTTTIESTLLSYSAAVEAVRGHSSGG